MPKTFGEAKQRLKPRTRHTSDELAVYHNNNNDPPKDNTKAILIPSKVGSHDDMSYSFGWYPILGEHLLIAKLVSSSLLNPKWDMNK